MRNPKNPSWGLFIAIFGPIFGFSPLIGSADQPSESKMTTKERADFVDFHNQVRKEVGVAPVQWSEEIAKVAQEWADHLAKTGKFEHRPRSGSKSSPYGENLAAGFGGGYTILRGAESWYAEKKDYKPGEKISNDFQRLSKIGHYTQMVWSGTTHIGAGYAVIQKGRMKGGIVVVCNYNPPGNMMGQAPF